MWAEPAPRPAGDACLTGGRMQALQEPLRRSANLSRGIYGCETDRIPSIRAAIGVWQGAQAAGGGALRLRPAGEPELRSLRAACLYYTWRDRGSAEFGDSNLCRFPGVFRPRAIGQSPDPSPGGSRDPSSDGLADFKPTNSALPAFLLEVKAHAPLFASSPVSGFCIILLRC